MSRSLRTLACLALLGALTACEAVKHDIRESSTRSMEDQLKAAGFKIMLADTQERQKMLNSLPPERVTRIPRPDNVYYIYPDPDVCSCLYVGREVEFEKLQQLGAELAQSNRAMITHEIAENQQAGWAPSGPWGNWGYWGITNPNSMGRPAWDPE
ncbi:hypothetical protein JCM19379_21400 [Methyloparacoccus murrellii]